MVSKQVSNEIYTRRLKTKMSKHVAASVEQMCHQQTPEARIFTKGKAKSNYGIS